MDRRVKFGFVLFVLTAICGALLIGPSLGAQSEGEKPQECCFVHPNYQGVCSVAPAEDETCNDILNYLNTPATVGKTYCNSTRIRGGWEVTACPKSE